MRLHYAVLFVATVVGSSNAVLLANDATSDVSVNSVLGDLGGVSTNRFLRIHKVTETNKNDEERGINPQSIPGSSVVSKLLKNNEMDDVTQKLAVALQKDDDVDDVFAMLKLNVPDKNVFDDPVFLHWAKYVDDFNQKKGNKDSKSMLPMLKTQYGDDNLAIMLEAAAKVEITSDVAKKLQREQMNLWKAKGVTTDELFKTYKLDVFEDGVTNVLANPGVNVWVKYADEFNPGEKTTLFDTIRKTYSDDLVVSKILNAGEMESTTKKLATELQSQQVTRWLAEDKSPDDIFKLLSLEKGGGNLLAKSELYTFVNYAQKFKEKNTGTTKVTLFKALTSHYEEYAIVAMLNYVANLPPTMKSTREGRYAANVQAELLEKWAQEEKALIDVVTTLGVTTPKRNEVFKAYLPMRYPDLD
ncbi:Avirulence (Avh) protein [Phytophthora megakarya]|uniref:RxLR effector protein n=1 Tax=Phytophthora megakarya TaxID=4795 RepID=A0A225VH80_9STRA|nr:Avirulence (Avh) protein [Phytophthora megakarya]